MDELSLAVLQAELKDDCRVLNEAASLAATRFGGGSPPELEAAAFQLNRVYNVIEQIAMRVAKAFENHLESETSWHAELLRRLSIDIPGVRPALFSHDLISDLQELKGFRHVVRHAYELTLDKEKMNRVLASAQRAAELVPVCCRAFLQSAAREQGGSLPEWK